MKASDVMVRDVITVEQGGSVAAAAQLMIDNDISALPVVDKDGQVVGILSEADLIHREEIRTEKKVRWWLEAVTPAAAMADEFVKSHGKRVEEVMSRDIVSATEDTPLDQIATLLEKHRIKRVPILKNGKLVGIVSRANLVQALASSASQVQKNGETDSGIRLEILSKLADQQWSSFGDRNIIVRDGIVHLWGLVGSPSEHNGLIVLAENVSGVTAVKDEMITAY